jgi:hypothetical protein
MELIEKVLDGATISLTCGEQNEPGRRMRVQAGSCLLPHLGTEALSRGTGSSNPFPSSAESATNPGETEIVDRMAPFQGLAEVETLIEIVAAGLLHDGFIGAVSVFWLLISSPSQRPICRTYPSEFARSAWAPSGAAFPGGLAVNLLTPN